MSGKSLVVLTNFWDANFLIDHRYMLIHDPKIKKVYKINFLFDKNIPSNFSVHSIALSPPGVTPKNLKNLVGINRLDFFCPTYDILKRYKKDNNWDSYTKDYLKLIKGRKERIREWFGSLKSDWVYFLCCWENTATSAHCHRELLHGAFLDSKIAKNKLISIYRHGDKIYKNEEPDVNNWGDPLFDSLVDTLSPVPPNANGNMYQSFTYTNQINGGSVVYRHDNGSLMSIDSDFRTRPLTPEQTRRYRRRRNTPDVPPSDTDAPF